MPSPTRTALLLAAALACPVAAAAQLALPPLSFPGSQTTVSIRIHDADFADLDGDGHTDVVVATNSELFTFGNDDLAVLLGLGGGRFGAPTTLKAQGNPTSLSLHDLDLDGEADLVVANSQSNSVIVRLGNGDGSFQPTVALPGTLSVSNRTEGVAVGDVDGDTLPDIVSVAPIEGVLQLWRGLGGGAFAAPLSFAAGSAPWNVLLHDLNGDDALDAVVTDTGGIAVLLGLGGGSFSAPQAFPASLSPRSIALGDLDGDGDADLALSREADPGVVTLLGAGDGSFGAPQLTHTPGARAENVALADLDGDGFDDLAVAARTFSINAGQALLLRGRGDGSFHEPHRIPVGERPRAVLLHDFAGSSALDLFLVNEFSGDVGVFLGDGAGGFASAPPPGVGDPARLPQLELARAVPPGPGSSPGHALGGPAAGTTTGDIELNQNLGSAKISAPQGIATADFDADGALDLAVSAGGLDELSVLFGRGDGRFTSPLSLPTGDLPWQLVAADLSGDGAPDLAVANFESHDLSLWFGDGAGGFSNAGELALPGEPADLAAGDLDGDGVTDLVALAQNQLVVLQGAGGGAFAAPELYAVTSPATSIDLGDVNDDGTLDVVDTHGFSQGRVGVWLGVGDGTFVAGTDVFTATRPGNARLVDLDLDGALDVLLSTNNIAKAGVHWGRGDGSFSVRQPVITSGSATALDAADVNGDGLPDLVLTVRNADALIVSYGLGERSFTQGDAYFAPSAFALGLGDFDGDTRPDVAATNVSEGLLTVLLNQH